MRRHNTLWPNANNEVKMKYSMQDALNIMWSAFVVAELPQSVGPDSCLYGGPNGTGCAVGVLMRREDALALDEATDSYYYLVEDPIVLKTLEKYISKEDLDQDGPFVNFLTTCQKAHDVYARQNDSFSIGKAASQDYRGVIINDPGSFSNYMRQALTIIAKAYNLEVPEDKSPEELDLIVNDNLILA